MIPAMYTHHHRLCKYRNPPVGPRSLDPHDSMVLAATQVPVNQVSWAGAELGSTSSLLSPAMAAPALTVVKPSERDGATWAYAFRLLGDAMRW